MNIISKSILSMAAILAVAATSQAAGVSQFKDVDKYLGSKRYASAPKAFTYMNDGSNYLQLTQDGKKIIKYATGNGKEIDLLLDLDNTREGNIDKISGFKMSPQENKILVWKNSKSIYRRSFDAEYYVYDIRTRILRPLSTDHPRQQAPLFSPDGRMIAFVAGNNIYLKQLDYWTERAVTTDGAKNMIINGVPDWTYEEEFTTASSMTWAPDNSTLCYIKYNEAAVPMFTFPLYEGVCDKLTEYSLYPGLFTYKYPVAGENNSVVSVHAYNIDNRTTYNINLPKNTFEYIPRISYAHSAERLMITTLNRAQTRMELFAANPKSTVVKSVLVEEYKAWLTPATYEDIKYFPDFFVITSSRTGYDHLYQYSYTGSLIKQLTSGTFDVLKYYGYDSSSGHHYFQSTASGPINRVISSVNSKGNKSDYSPARGCASATFSPDMSYFTVRFSDIKTPPTYTLYSGSKKIRTLEDNSELKQNYADAPKREFFTMNSDGYTLNGYLIKPAGYNPIKKYPVIMYQYSGPAGGKLLGQTTLVNGENAGKEAGSQSSGEPEPEASAEPSGTSSATGYFASARLNRQQARDSALQLLQEAAADEGAQQSIIDEANASIQAMAALTLSEAQVENLVTAKGYGDCVCFIGENSASVVVSSTADGLRETDIAKISEIVMEETGLSPSKIKIIETEP